MRQARLCRARRRGPVAFRPALELLEERIALTLRPIGPESLVNITTAGDQKTVSAAPGSMALDGRGDYVIVWESAGQDGSGVGVYGRLYNAAGMPQTGEFQVNTTTGGNQRYARVAMDHAGDFVVTWSSAGQDGSGYGVYARRYNAAGVAQSGEFLVNQTTAGDQEFSAVAMDDQGDFVIAWNNYDTTNAFDVYARRYNAAGVAQSGQFRVNTTPRDYQLYPSVAMDATGDFVITWSSRYQDGSGYGVYAQRYNAAGTAQGGEFRVNQSTSQNQWFSSVAMDDHGDFVITWTSYDTSNTQLYGVYARRYNAAGTALGGEFRVNQATSYGPEFSSVAMDDSGDFAISWQSSGQDGSGYGVYARYYNAAGTAQSNEFRVNTTTTGNQCLSTVAMDDNGDFAIVWTSYGQDGSGAGVYAQRYDVVNDPPVAQNVSATTNENTAVNASFSAWDPENDSLTFAVVSGPSHGSVTVQSNGTFTYTPGTSYSGSDSFTYKANDGSLDSNVATVSITVQPVNQPPVLDSIPDQSIAEGSTLQLTAQATDPESPPETLTFSLGQGAPAGMTIDGTTGQLTLPAGDGPASYSATVIVTDNGSPPLSDSKTFNITVNNVAPTAAVTGPTDGVPWQTLSFVLSATDPSSADQVAGFTFAVAWGDGATQTQASVSPLTLSHAYSASGSYTISVTATDKDGGTSTAATLGVTVVNAELQGGNLAVGGTAGADSFVYSPGTTTGAVVVTRNGTSLGIFHPTGGITTYGGTGTDTVTVNGGSAADAFSILSSSLTLNGVSYTGDSVEKWKANGLGGTDTFTVAVGGAATIDGGTGTNTLIGPDATNAWVLTGPGAGTLNGMSFLNLQNLTGGSGADAFKIKPGASVIGTINGGAGTADKLDFSLYGAAVTVNLQTKTAPGMGHFSNIEVLTGSTASDTLIGANLTNTWQITVINGGKIGSYSFGSFENLVGGSAGDTFKLSNGKGVSGTINGGAGSNWLDYSAYTTAITVNLSAAAFGALPADSATGIDGGAANGEVNIANVRAGSGAAMVVGGGGNILIGGAGNDTLVDTYAGTSAGGGSLLIGGNGADTLTGGSAGDLLIGEKASYASKNANLQDILTYWNSNSHSAAFTALQSSTGLPGTGERLVWGSTVTGDSRADVLNGTTNASAIDWFFAGSEDTITNGRHGTDYRNNGLY
jgi:hypothetical protein